ncbi:conjugative relaxase [Cronobacter sakazakii]|nr:conjugative relaxase [Cronobacter sakazakii]
MMTHTILTADKSVDRAASYYEDGVDDYYQKEGESKQWQGKGAEFLGLSGDVNKEEFKSLLSGRLPDGTVFRNSVRHDSHTRIAIDFTFQAPKSVSLQALVHGDPEIIAAHDKAVSHAVSELEKRAVTRQKIDGKTYKEDTGNLIVAKFRHETNREQEPHLHTHALAINATLRSDGVFRALVNDELVKNAKFYGALYRTVLAAELEKLGYLLRHENDSFELAHITRKQIEGMSTRTLQINDGLEEMGLTRESATAEQKTYVAKKTRKTKDVGIDGEMLHDRWIKISKELGINYNIREWNYGNTEAAKAAEMVVPKLEELTKEQAAQRAVRFAINHHTERHTIITHSELTETALLHCMGRSSLATIEKEIESLKSKGQLLAEEPLYTASGVLNGAGMTKNDWIKALVESGKSMSDARRNVSLAITKGRLTRSGQRYTTQKAMDQEKRILQSEFTGRNAAMPILSLKDTHAFLENTSLRKDQKSAAELILTSPNRIIGVQGQAGVGKSYMSKSVTDRIKEEGYSMHILAPYGSQKKSLIGDGMEARTVASFLHTLSREHKLDEKTVILVDEAGVLPNRLVDKLCAISSTTGARLVFLGDTEQTKAVEAGIPFAIMQRNGMETALMNEIQRQKNNPELLRAVELAAVGKASESLGLLTEVSETKKAPERYKRIADEYVSLPDDKRKDTLVITGTNDSRIKMNALIREGLGIESQIEISALTRLDTTQATRRFSKYYATGDTVIQPERDYPRAGLVRGASYRVVAHGEGNTLIVQDEAGKSIPINPAQLKQLSVYREERQKYGVGEQLVVTRNNAGLDLANGDRFTISAIYKDNIYLTDGRREIVLKANEKQHLDYAYVTTVHSAQGLTATNVLANIETKSRTVARDWFYVGISRAKEKVKIFTDDKTRLPVSVSRESQKTAALELRHKTAQKIREKGKQKGLPEANKQNERGAVNAGRESSLKQVTKSHAKN